MSESNDGGLFLADSPPLFVWQGGDLDLDSRLTPILFLIAHLDDLCIYYCLFVLIIPTERRVQQCTKVVKINVNDDKVGGRQAGWPLPFLQFATAAALQLSTALQRWRRI